MSRPTGKLFGWALAVLVIALFTTLGVWQLGRAKQKEAMLAASHKVLSERRPMPLSAANDEARRHDYDWVSGQGGFAARAPLLLDNQMRNGLPGVRVYRMFHPMQGGELLVDLGWLPLPGARVLPTADSLMAPDLGEAQRISGLLMPPPASGVKIGPGMVQHDGVWLMTRFDSSEIKKVVGNPGLPLSPRVLRLDPALPIGYARDLDILPNTLPPERHLGYAVQWFGLALAVFITALVLTLRGRRRGAATREKMMP